jgi:hypothetical protein
MNWLQETMPGLARLAEACWAWVQDNPLSAMVALGLLILVVQLALIARRLRRPPKNLEARLDEIEARLYQMDRALRPLSRVARAVEDRIKANGPFNNS